MKKNFLNLALPFVAIIMGAITMNGCKKDETTATVTSPVTATSAPVSAIVTSGGA